MNSDDLRQDSVARDLVLTDLDSPASMTRLVVAHSLAPVRRMWRLPAPRADEGDRPSLSVAGDGGSVETVHLSPRLDESTAHFEPVIAGLMLYSCLFPYARASFASRADIVRNPSSAWLDGSWFMAAFIGYAEVERQIAGLYEPPTTDKPNLAAHTPWPNAEAMDELRAIQALLQRLIGPPGRWADYQLERDTGLERLNIPAALEMDAIVQHDVRRRLVWFGSAEPILTEESPDGEPHDLVVDGGFFPALVPESISGVIGMDYVDGLARHRRAAVCAHCNRALILTNQQVARARKGDPVYHTECAREHRLEYFRTRKGSE